MEDVSPTCRLTKTRQETPTKDMSSQSPIVNSDGQIKEFYRERDTMNIIANYSNYYLATDCYDGNISFNQEDAYYLPEIFSETLSFVGHDSEFIPSDLGRSYGAFTKRLDLSYNCLRDLTGIEQFSHLEELVLDSNLLNDNMTLPRLPNLHTLTLNKNKIRELDPLLDKIQKAMPDLTYLSLLGNEACPNQLSASDKDEEDYQRYRYYVLHRLPNLKFLDSSAVKLSEKKEAVRRGPFLKVVRPTFPDQQQDTPELQQPQRYTPLPSKFKENSSQVTFGKCRYVYYGRHSEGNRFIRNNDL